MDPYFWETPHLVPLYAWVAYATHDVSASGIVSKRGSLFVHENDTINPKP